MITRDLGSTSLDASFADGAPARWLLNGRSNETGAGGVVGIVDLAPGRSIPLRRTAAGESVVYVLDGRAEIVTGASGLTAAPVGTLLYAPANSWYGIRAGAAPARLLIVVATAPSAGAVAWEAAAGGGDADPGAPRPVILEVNGAEQVEMHDPPGGRHRIRARWLLDGERHGTADLIVGQCSFGPESVHELHRHPGAPEALFAYAGDGIHLGEHGAHPQRTGELVYVPPGEWHGLRGPERGRLEALFLLFGVNRFDDVGYELFTAPA